MNLELSEVGTFFIRVSQSREAKQEVIRSYLATRTQTPPETFQQWLSRQPGMQQASPRDLDELHKLVFELDRL